MVVKGLTMPGALMFKYGALRLQHIYHACLCGCPSVRIDNITRVEKLFWWNITFQFYLATG